jgi:hypothetical protein
MAELLPRSAAAIAEPSVPLGLSCDPSHVYTAHYPPAEPLTLPGVTNAVNVLGKWGLIGWSAKVASTYAAENLELFTKLVKDLGPTGAADAVTRRSEAIRDDAARIGSEVHQLCSDILTGRPFEASPQHAPYLEHFRRFLAEWRWQAYGSELMVYSERHGYAGTLDALGTFQDRPSFGQLEVKPGAWTLLDIKTSRHLYTETALQLAAYGRAEWIGWPGSTVREAIPAPPDQSVVLHLRPDGYKLVPYVVGEPEWRAFRAALELYRWTKGPAKRVKLAAVSP